MFLYTYITYPLFQLLQSYMFSIDMCCFNGSIYFLSFGMRFSLSRFYFLLCINIKSVKRCISVYELSLLIFEYESPFIMRLQSQFYCWQPIHFSIYYINTLSQFHYSILTFIISYLSIISYLFKIFIYITMGIQRLQRISFTSFFLNSLISIVS